MNEPEKMKPVIILKPGMMKQADIKKLEGNNFLVVVAKDPSQVRFIEPPPMGYSVQEKAAIALCRFVLNCGTSNTIWYRSQLHEKLATIMVEGSALQIVPKVPTQ